MNSGSAAESRTSRIIGIDFGLARIGLAISDPQKIIATPLVVLTTEKTVSLTVKKIVKEIRQRSEGTGNRIEEIVVGMPLLMSGKRGSLADDVLHFISLLKAELGSEISIFTWDERLSSVQAERSLREGTFTRKKRTRYVDTVAATIILQNYLDFKKLQTG